MLHEKILIMGTTYEGEKFRPSDWAERLYYMVADYGTNGRITFNPLVNINQEDSSKCFVINATLKNKNPKIFRVSVGSIIPLSSPLPDVQKASDCAL